MKRMLRGALAVALLPLAIGVGGCGGGGATRFPGNEPRAGGGGSLAYAISAQPGGLDPLSASSVATRTVTQQVFLPLIADLDGPYGTPHNVPGPAAAWRHSGDFRVWSFRLRRGIRFQDGTPLNASAVLANAERWRTTAEGRLLLPGLIASDAPRPDLVRFILDRPVRALPAQLGNPRLGLVSPAALSPSSGRAAVLVRARGAGAGAFEIGGRSGSRLSLVRFRGWWGSRLGLGPALDEVAFEAVPDAAQRLQLLRDGDVEVASDLSRGAARSLRRDPLLSALGAGGGHALGFSRSVRGIERPRPQPLSGVWLAVLGPSG